MLGVVLLLGASRGQAWRVEYVGGTANDAALDGAGNVVAAGFIAGSFTVVKLAAGSGEEQWATPVDPGNAVAVTVDANDNVIAAGGLATLFSVVKLDGATGVELWRWSSADFGLPLSVTVDAAGDVIASGYIRPGSNEIVEIVKLAGADGDLLWETQFSYPDQEARASAVGVDAAGNVLAAGQVYESLASALLVLKLDGATGGEVWRHEIDDEPFAHGTDLAVAANGDAIVAGGVSSTATVFRYASATGAEVWRGDSLYGVYEAVALDPTGDVVAAGGVAPGFAPFSMVVSRFDGATGAPDWTQVLTRARGGYGNGVAVGGTGDVYATGYLSGAATSADFSVVRLDGTTGDARWQQFLDGSAPAESSLDHGWKVLVDAAGGAVAAGSILNDDHLAFAVFRFDGLTGAVGPVSGVSIKVKDHATDSAARRVLMAARDVSIVVPPEGSAGDPTLAGGTLRIANPLTSEQATLSLPASGWVAISGARSRGYAYSDVTGANGPCRKVRVQPGRMRAVCLAKQGPIPFTLDEPTQGTLGVSLTLGTSDPQCVIFGSNVRRDQGTANPGPQGLFQAGIELPALGTCP